MDSQHIDNLKKAGVEFANKYYHDWYNNPASLIKYVHHFFNIFIVKLDYLIN